MTVNKGSDDSSADENSDADEEENGIERFARIAANTKQQNQMKVRRQVRRVAVTPRYLFDGQDSLTEKPLIDRFTELKRQ